ncbi:MAG: hypothetical protein GWM87_08430 [Xanthomonadales bacterium]|nr:regulatory protein RecX [Xanthomonadales bacterium]NIX12954.1 hypothetical protein [Xanthomonadales bacterium]
MAYRYLGRREYSRQELTRKLQQRGVETATAEAVVGELDAEGLVSDERFTESFVRSRVSRMYGPLKIRAQLRQKGVGDDLIAVKLASLEDIWPDLALSWVRKRAGEPFDRKEKARLYRSGMNRGFPHDIMMRALDRFEAGT